MNLRTFDLPWDMGPSNGTVLFMDNSTDRDYRIDRRTFGRDSPGGNGWFPVAVDRSNEGPDQPFRADRIRLLWRRQSRRSAP